MKVLSLNLHCFKEENRIEKLNKIVQFILDNEVDVCIFQEVAQLNSEEMISRNIKKGNNAYYIAEKIKYNIAFHPVKRGFDVLDEGLAFVSKYPILHPQSKIISYEDDYSKWYKRDCFYVNINGVSFYNVHIGWDCCGEKGINQIKNLLNFIQNEGLFFVAGDFNYPDGSSEINYVKKSLYSLSELVNIDSAKHPTFHYQLDNINYDFENRMIDFVFSNEKIQLKDFKIVFNSDYVSDHNGLFFEF